MKFNGKLGCKLDQNLPTSSPQNSIEPSKLASNSNKNPNFTSKWMTQIFKNSSKNIQSNSNLQLHPKCHAISIAPPTKTCVTINNAIISTTSFISTARFVFE
jgi:hypothetical protein